MSRKSQQEIVSLVIAERQRQDENFGLQTHPAGRWLAILVEEVGEVATETLCTPCDRRPYPPSVEALRAELVQVAAVCVAWLEAIGSPIAAEEHA